MDVLKRYRVPFVRPASLCLPGSLILQYSTDFDYSRGDYGLQRESMLFDVPLGVTADYGDWRFGLSAPRLYSDGVAARALPAGGGGGGPSLESDHNGGLGDVVTTGSYLIDPEIDAPPWIELGVQVLWPTRTNEDLETGDFGFAMQVDLFEEIDLGDWGSIMPFVSSDRGALPEAFELGIVAPLHSRARGSPLHQIWSCVRERLAIRSARRSYASRAELGSARADSF